MQQQFYIWLPAVATGRSQAAEACDVDPVESAAFMVWAELPPLTAIAAPTALPALPPAHFSL